MNAELSNSRIVSKNLHILGTRFGPLNVGNRRRWLPDGRQIGSFIGRWPCNLVRESWERRKETKREKNPPENGCQVLDRFCFVHVCFAGGWECWDLTTVLHQQKVVVLIKHFCSKLDQSIGQWTSLPTQCIQLLLFIKNKDYVNLWAFIPDQWVGKPWPRWCILRGVYLHFLVYFSCGCCGDKLVFIFHFNVWMNAFHLTSWQNFDLSHKNVNIKAYEINKSKKKFKLFTINLN